MTNLVCDFCLKASNEVEKLLPGRDAAICNECLAFLSIKMGLLPPADLGPDNDEIPVREQLVHTFTHTLELEGHIDQKYDVFVLQCLLDLLRSEHWDVSIELARLTRSDGFVRRTVADCGTRYAVDLLIRSNEPCARIKLQRALEDHWARLTSANTRLLHDMGTRNLLGPRLDSLAAYLVQMAARGDHSEDWQN